MKKTETSPSQFHGVGRRKRAVARVWIKSGKGAIVVNGRKHDTYFDTTPTRNLAEQAFVITRFSKKFDVIATIDGGGIVSQATALRLSLSRALVAFDENLKPILKKHKLLTVDARVKERKKYGQKGARAKFQFVKR
jgi:small subunit ribosomal protein S9